MRKALMIFTALLCQGCARTPAIVTTPPARCADLIPNGWTTGVDSAAIPDTTAAPGMTPLDAALMAARLWAGAYVAQDGQLDKANGRTSDAIAIMRQCEAQANAARPK